MSESSLLLESLLLSAAAAMVAVEPARAEARPAAFLAASVFSPASVATEATATEATSGHRGGEADAPCCISALFALFFAARGGDSRMAVLDVRLRAALAAG